MKGSLDELLHLRYKCVQGYGFLKEACGFERSHFVYVRRRDENHRNLGELGGFALSHKKPWTIQHRHVHVENDEIRRPRTFEKSESFLSVLCHSRLVTRRLKHHRDDFSRIRVIIYDKNALFFFH